MGNAFDPVHGRKGLQHQMLEIPAGDGAAPVAQAFGGPAGEGAGVFLLRAAKGGVGLVDRLDAGWRCQAARDAAGGQGAGQVAGGVGVVLESHFDGVGMHAEQLADGLRRGWHCRPQPHQAGGQAGVVDGGLVGQDHADNAAVAQAAGGVEGEFAARHEGAPGVVGEHRPADGLRFGLRVGAAVCDLEEQAQRVAGGEAGEADEEFAGFAVGWHQRHAALGHPRALAAEPQVFAGYAEGIHVKELDLGAGEAGRAVFVEVRWAGFGGVGEADCADLGCPRFLQGRGRLGEQAGDGLAAPGAVEQVGGEGQGDEAGPR